MGYTGIKPASLLICISPNIGCLCGVYDSDYLDPLESWPSLLNLLEFACQKGPNRA
jgi:hypothetical protein